MKGESGRLIVDGDHFLVGGSVVEINGQAAGKLKYPAAFAVQGGEITRLMTKEDVTAMLPLGVEVSLTVFTPSTGKRSPQAAFRIARVFGAKLEDVLPKPRHGGRKGQPEQRRHPFAGLAALRDKPRRGR